MRVREGYTCDCFDGFQLDMAQMACVGEFQIRVAAPGSTLALMALCGGASWPMAHFRDVRPNLGSLGNPQWPHSEAAQCWVGVGG